MKVLCFIAVLFAFQSTSIAQAPDPGLKKAQKALKNLLINDTPSINSVKFDGCRMSIKSGVSSFWSPAPETGSAGRTGYFNDQTNFSGPDHLVFERRWDNYLIDLKLLDASKIRSTPAHRKSLALLALANTRAGVITPITPNDMREKYSPGIYSFAVNARSVEKLLNAFKNITDICTKLN